MNDFKLRMPIETLHEGEKTTKVCVEDVSKILSRTQSAINKAVRESKEIMKSVRKRYISTHQDSEGYLIIGRGVSQPCHNDVYDEITGNDIAFMKAKLNANIKKHNVLVRTYNKFITLLDSIDEDITKIDDNIKMDLENLRVFNENYLDGIEDKLGIV